MADWISGLSLIALIIVVATAYSFRFALKGAARFDRVDRQGGSYYLGKTFKEMGYWALQPIGQLLIACRISANQISWCSFALGSFAAALLASGRFGLGSVAVAVAAILDALDGMVARATGKVSVAGEVLDSVLDRYVDFFFLAGLLVYYRTVPIVQILCLIALLGSFMVSYSTAKAEALAIQIPPGGMRRPERMVYLLLGSVFSTFTMSVEPLSLSQKPLGYPMIVSLIVVGTVSNVTAALRFRMTVKLAQSASK